MRAVRGAIASLVTPFTADGRLDVAGLSGLSARIATSGFDFLCFAGGTGEFLSLTPEERDQGLKAVIEGAGGVPVVASALHTDPLEILRSADRFARIGAAAIMVMPPYFYAPSQDVIYDHLSSVAKASPLPVILFNSAARAGGTMTTSTILRLADCSANVVGVKETTSRMEDIESLVSRARPDFHVIQAHEPLILPSYVLGATGSFGSLANIIPRTIVGLHRAIDKGDMTAAQDLTRRLSRVAEAAYATTIPVGIKHIMARLGVSAGGVRRPLTMAVSERIEEKLSAIVADIQRLESTV